MAVVETNADFVLILKKCEKPHYYNNERADLCWCPWGGDS